MKIAKAEYYEYTWVIDQACSVKMAGYWPSSFFACLWTETDSRSINTQKSDFPKNEHLPQLLLQVAFLASTCSDVSCNSCI